MSQARTWFDQPISGPSCALGWCVATALFIAFVSVFGFTGADTFESVFSTWAIAHGQLACAFPSGFRVTAPLYPLLSGGIAAAAHLGHTVPFPPRSAMGPHCSMAFLAINSWSTKVGVLARTLQIGFSSWFVLMVGAIALLRASGRGRCRWEPAALIGLACLPPVWSCIQATFHPEDLLALGFALAAVACALRGSWVSAGILIGLAFMSQQFALLVAVPLLIMAPARRRVAFGWSAAFTVAVIAAPLIMASSRNAAHAILLGTGNTGGIGGSVLWELGFRDTPLFVLSRIVPLGVSALLSWWVVRRLGRGALEPVVLFSVVAISLGLRLVFEEQVFEYYFMALCVSLVLLDVIRGQIRGSLVAWLVIVPTVYLENINLPTPVTNLVPVSVIAIAGLVVVSKALLGGPRRELAPWVAVLVAAALITWNNADFHTVLPAWLCQVVVVIPGIMLAGAPQLAELRRHATQPLVDPRVRWQATRTLPSVR